MNSSMIPSSNHTTPYNTLSRPISAQGYDDNTLSAGRMPRHDDRGNYGHHGGSRVDMDGYLAMNQSNPALFDQNDRGNYSRERIPVRFCCLFTRQGAVLSFYMCVLFYLFTCVCGVLSFYLFCRVWSFYTCLRCFVFLHVCVVFAFLHLKTNMCAMFCLFTCVCDLSFYVCVVFCPFTCVWCFVFLHVCCFVCLHVCGVLSFYMCMVFCLFTCVCGVLSFYMCVVFCFLYVYGVLSFYMCVVFCLFTCVWCFVFLRVCRCPVTSFSFHFFVVVVRSHWEGE